MAILLVPGDVGDGALRADGWLDEGGVGANGDFENDAKAGNNAIIDPDGEPLSGQKLAIGGQKYSLGKQTTRAEGFLAFRRLAVPAGIGELELVNSAIRHSRYGKFHDGAPYPDDSIRWFNRPWASPLTTSSWVDLNPLSGDNTPAFETKNWIQDGQDSIYEVSGRQQYADTLAKLQTAGDLNYMLTLTSACVGVYPVNKNGNFLGYIPSANHTLLPTYFRPFAVLRFVRRHLLNHVLGASIQLADGTAVFLRYNDEQERVSLYYQKVGQTTPTLIANLASKTPTHDYSAGFTNYFGIDSGNQTFGITCDPSNNLYVFGSRGNEQAVEYNTQFMNIQTFRYTGSNGNHTWVSANNGTTGDAMPNEVTASQVHRGQPNNFAPVWVPTSQGGARGQILCLHSRRDAQWSRFQMGIAGQYAGYYLDALGISQRLHGAAWFGDANVSSWWRPWNSSATGLDAFRDGNTIRYAAFVQAPTNFHEERSAVGKTTVAANGTMPPLTFIQNSLSNSTPHDPDAKIRALWMGENSAYYAIARHGHIEVHRKSDDSIFKQVDLSASNISGFPSRADLQKSAAWDVIWVTNDDRIAVYYRDNNNVRKLRRVFWNFQTGVVSASEDFTPTALGESGSDIIAIRLPRQQTDTRCILIDVAMQDGAGAPAGLITLRDTSLDVPPASPIISPIDQFNASGTKAIEWTFVDGNPLDYATFQDVEIRNLTTGVTAHFVTHVAAVVVDANSRLYRYTIGSSVLTNDTQYQIRIRSYDSVDVVGDWSTWINFATTATGGIVTIIDPATDLEPLNRSSRLIKWTYANSDPEVVQLGYRVRVYNDETGVVASDSGAVTSEATEYLVGGMLSDVRYRVEVTIADSNSQTSGAGTRILFPDFNNPSIPAIVVVPFPGYNEVQITNPPPDGENPATTLNQIARRESTQGEDAYIVVGTAPPNGVFKDWTVASGTEYVYKARGQS